jgi:hypothetical protein
MDKFLATFQRQQLSYQQSPSANCPSACGCPDADWKHFPRCPHPERGRTWQEFQLAPLSATMNRWEIDPSLRRILPRSMISPLLTSPAIPLTSVADEFAMFLTTQRSIGEDSLLFGFFSTDWARLQQDRYLRAVRLPHQKYEAAHAVRSLISTAFHDQRHVVWLLRSQHLHSTDP